MKKKQSAVRRMLSLFLAFVMLCTIQGLTVFAETKGAADVSEEQQLAEDSGQSDSLDTDHSKQSESNVDSEPGWINGQEQPDSDQNSESDANTESEGETPDILKDALQEEETEAKEDASKVQSQSENTDVLSEETEQSGRLAPAQSVSPANPVHHCAEWKDDDDVTTWSYVYFGSYPQTEVTEELTSAITGAAYDSNGDAWVNGVKYRRISKSDTNNTEYFGSKTYRYFKWERIKWKVLNNDGSTLFLAADKGLDCKDYNETYTDITWENCTLRNWLNNEFYGTAFSADEQGAIVEQDVVSGDNPFYNTECGNDTRDKVYLLSVGEAINPSYGFCDNYNTHSPSRRVQASDYAHARGAYVNPKTAYQVYQGNCWWWLRSPGYKTSSATSIESGGNVNRNGSDVDGDVEACVPVLHIDLSSDLWSPADNESGEEGGDSGEETGGNSIQCGTSCSVELGKTRYMSVNTYADSYEKLKEITESVTWESQDPSVAVVKSSEVLLSTMPKNYSSDQASRQVWSGNIFLSVTGVAEGTTTMTGRASDGSTAVCKITVEAGADTETGSGDGLILGENVSGTAGGGVADFFPATWSLKSTVFPVNINKIEGKDGSYKMRGTIGIGKSDWLDDNSKWDKFKKNVDDAQKYTGQVDCLNRYREIWGVKSLTMVETSKFEVLPKLSVMGYFENSYDKNGNLISQTGKLAADAKWSGSISWQFATPIGPLYLNLEGSGVLSGTIGPKYDYQTKKVQVADGNLRFVPTVALEGGYGIDKAATIGAQGELSLPITMIPATKGESIAKASLHVKLVFVIDYKQELASNKAVLWDTTKKQKMYGAGTGGNSLSEGAMSAMDTSFAKYEGAWCAENTSKRRQAARAVSQKTEVLLQDGVLPSSLPMQEEIDGKKVMVFQSYDASKDTLNSCVLKYSVCENGTWSEPQPVWDNGCCDMYADMKVVNGRLVLAWQKEKTAVTGDIGTDGSAVIQQIAKNSEICFAEFDPAANVFTNQTYVTNNEVCDMMPRICNGTDEIMLSWVRNSEADLMQEKGNNTIYTSVRDGSSFKEEEILTQSLGTVEDYIVYHDSGETKTLYLGRTGTEEAMTAVFDEKNQSADVFAEFISPASERTVTNMHYADGNINFFSNGLLYCYHPADGTMNSFHAGDGVFGSTAQYCTNGEKSGYVWSIYDEETKTGRITASVKTESGYSDPVTLYEKQDTMWRYIDPLLDNAGGWQLLTNATQVEDGEENHNSLRYITPSSDSGIELAGASVDENDVVDGLTGVDYFVKNTGDTTIHSLQMDITLSNGTVITREIPVTILPGESVAETAYVDLSKIDQSQEISIAVYKEGQNKEECTVKDKAGQSDVAVSGTFEETGGKVIVTADVSNDSAIDADTTLYLYSDEKQTKELCSPQAGSITAGGSRQFRMEVKKSDISYNKNDAAYLTLKAVVKGGDCNEDNNIAYVILYKPKPVGGETPQSPAKPDGGSAQSPAKPSNPPVSKKTVSISKNAKVTLSKTSYTYNGKSKKPGVTVKFKGKKLTKNKDYTLTYQNNKKVGTASLVIKGKGTYTGKITKTFKIVPKGTSISGKIKAQKKGFTVKWKKQKASTSGYQVQYSTSKKFTKKTTKTRTVKKNTTTKLTAKKLKANKKYYVRVRTYKTVKGKKYVSSWSKVKTVKTKK